LRVLLGTGTLLTLYGLVCTSLFTGC